MYHVFVGVVGSIFFGFAGLFLMLTGYKLFDIITPRLDVEKELEKNNLSVGIVVAALIFSVAYIAASVIR